MFYAYEVVMIASELPYDAKLEVDCDVRCLKSVMNFIDSCFYINETYFDTLLTYLHAYILQSCGR